MDNIKVLLNNADVYMFYAVSIAARLLDLSNVDWCSLYHFVSANGARRSAHWLVEPKTSPALSKNSFAAEKRFWTAKDKACP